MAQIIQSAKSTFSNNYSITATKTVTFPTPLTDLSNVQILATARKTYGQYNSARQLITITYDPETLTTTGVTFTATVDKGYIGKLEFDYMLIGGSPVPPSNSFLLKEDGFYILQADGVSKFVVNGA